MVTKAEVEIKEKEKSPAEKALDEALKRLEKPIQPPPIEDTLGKVEAALAQAKKVRQKLRQTWYCTECGGAHIQLYSDGSGHFSVDASDDEFVNATTGNQLAGKEANVMKNYAVPRAISGEGGNAVSANRKTLAKMQELKGEK